jgi:hypothetical protein
MTGADASNSAEHLLANSKAHLDARDVRQNIDKIKVILAPYPHEERQRMIDIAMNELSPQPHVVVHPAVG